MYEGYTEKDVTFISYLSALLGCKHMILTNASGGGVKGMEVGSFMVSTDHINWIGRRPLCAIASDPRMGVEHPDSSNAHTTYL